ncbi:hypothetical protein ACHHYP_01789 [Achlya hypogyna]|uniref:Ricin B lectin domain-containing protein n=1 Tax=Achlya hypogyna TaxID=1202772 RepID=A0A1V9ZT77_ACHHY|nr:hypothetical protein ACHHYP_01789 [Achlya hypogyna]
MQLRLPLLAASAVALDALPRDNSTESALISEMAPGVNATGLESAVIQGEFGPRQWGIQRASEREGRPGTVIVTRHDAWLTMWSSGTVTTDRKMYAGERAWQTLESTMHDGFDMLQSMQTSLCLDAWWDDSAGRPKVHGWSCDFANNNQYWKYRTWETYTKIEHKKWGGWCLMGEADKGHPWMERCDHDDDRLLWNFVS